MVFFTDSRFGNQISKTPYSHKTNMCSISLCSGLSARKMPKARYTRVGVNASQPASSQPTNRGTLPCQRLHLDSGTVASLLQEEGACRVLRHSGLWPRTSRASPSTTVVLRKGIRRRVKNAAGVARIGCGGIHLWAPRSSIFSFFPASKVTGLWLRKSLSLI